MAPKFEETQIVTNKNHKEFFSDNKQSATNNQPDESHRLSYKIKKIIFRILGSRSKWEIQTDKIDGNNIKHIIIFRQDGIGDYIVSTPVTGWLKSALPQVEIDVLTSFRNDSIVKQDKNVNATFPIHPKSILHPFTFKLFKLRKRRYDIVIALDYTKTTYSALLARIIAPNAEKITVMHPTRKEIYGIVFNRQTKIEGGNTHWSQNMLKFVTENIEPVTMPDKKVFQPYVPIRETGNIKFPPILQNDKTESKYCIINISAYTERNKISLETIEFVSNELCRKYKNLIFFITGSPDDYTNIDEIVRQVSLPNCRELKLKMTDFVSFIKGAYFIISPDTAVIHIAAASGVPVVGIYSWFESARAWYPFNVPFSIVLSKDNQTVKSIEPARILEATEILVNCLENDNKV